LLDSKSHQHLHCHCAPPQLPTFPRRPTCPLSCLHEARTSSNTIPHRTDTTIARRSKRDKRSMDPFLSRSLGLSRQTLWSRHPVLPLHLPTPLADIHPAHSRWNILFQPIQPPPRCKPLSIPKRYHPGPKHRLRHFRQAPYSHRHTLQFQISGNRHPTPIFLPPITGSGLPRLL